MVSIRRSRWQVSLEHSSSTPLRADAGSGLLGAGGVRAGLGTVFNVLSPRGLSTMAVRLTDTVAEKELIYHHKDVAANAPPAQSAISRDRPKVR